MRCANPQCGQIAGDIFEGTLRLVELDLAPGARLEGNEGGFPVCTVPSRFFWLCPACSKAILVVRWTPAGVVVDFAPGVKKPIASAPTCAVVNGDGAKAVPSTHCIARSA
jgi:hypothetical protein